MVMCLLGCDDDDDGVCVALFRLAAWIFRPHFPPALFLLLAV
jgi:hypothetical protein